MSPHRDLARHEASHSTHLDGVILTVHPEDLNVLVLESLSQQFRHLFQQPAQIEDAGQFPSHEVQYVELGRPAGLGFVESGVLNGHRRLGGEKGGDVFISGGEFLRSDLVREV